MKEKKNVHAGHRARFCAEVEKNGILGLPDHKVLEYLLFFARPRIDTNPIAHDLIDRFGSLAAVLDADETELMKVPGVGPACARFLKLFPMINERYAIDKFKGKGELITIDDSGKFLVKYFLNKTNEEVYAFFLDNSGRLIEKETVYHGTINSTYVNTRTLTEAIIRHKATSIILAHNHPSGIAEPSEEDISLTRHLMDAFIPLGILIRAHLVVAKNKYIDIVPRIYDFEKIKPKYIAVMSPTPDLEKKKEETEKEDEL